MKKGLFLLIICLLLCCAVPVSAGSVPEDLLQSDGARIFFAEVTECLPMGESLKISLIPVQTVKGDVLIGEKAVYGEVIAVGDFLPRRGRAYLFAYFDENNPTYAFRVSSYDVSTLSLLVPEDIRDNMFGRFEKYLKNGSYTAAEQERQQRLGLSESRLLYDGQLPPLDNSRNPWARLLSTAAGTVALTATGVGIVLCVKARKRAK